MNGIKNTLFSMHQRTKLLVYQVTMVRVSWAIRKVAFMSLSPGREDFVLLLVDYPGGLFS